VYAAEEFANLAPPLPPVLPEWSPVAKFGGYAKQATVPASLHSRGAQTHDHKHICDRRSVGGSGCLCWAF
jgi:hypothetical protein